jgi:chromate transporter
MKVDSQAQPRSDEDRLVRGVERVPLLRLVAYFLRLGTVGFGGPIVLVGYMQRDLVEDKHWVSTEDYLQGLAFSQLSPGPLAAQLANYVGWVHSGTLGATLVGIAFVLPSLLMVLALAAMYVHFGQLAWIQGMFYGIGAAVSAIIVRSAWRLIQKTLGKDYLLWTVFAILTITTVWTESEFLALFILSGFVAMLIKAPPTAHNIFSKAVISPAGLVGLYAPAGTKTVMTVFLFFLKAGSFVFGSGLAIVPFLYGGVVGGFHWLTERQFLDAVAIAMITPGPVVITSGFIGYLVAGPLGALPQLWRSFSRPICWWFSGAPYYRRFAKNRQVKAFVQGVTAAAVGAIAGAAIILSKRAIMDLPTVLIAAVSLLLLVRFKKISEPLMILGAGIVGLTVKHAWL